MTTVTPPAPLPTDTTLPVPRVQLDAANFRRSVVFEEGRVIRTGRVAPPGPAGGRPAELLRAGRAWSRGGPIHRAGRRPEGAP